MSGTTCFTNDELEQYLVRYCTRELAPHFAVMLHGTWGSGKTWFINRLRGVLQEHHGKKVIYVSLYSVTKTSDITDQFFQQLHPKLASAPVQKSWSILKSVVKGTIKIDLDGDGKKDDLQLSISIPELEKSANPDNAVLVFDDLERCGMEVADALGFINQFVEHGGYRVIILAYEQKITSPKFHSAKEKVVGRTFEIQPDTRGALASFIAELSADDAINVLPARKEQILNVMAAANYRNLRQLRQAILDFSDIWNCLIRQDASLKSNAAFLDRLVHDIFAFSIELRAGAIKADDIAMLQDGSLSVKRMVAGLGGQQSEPAPAETRLKLHGLERTHKFALPAAAYAKFFSRGYLSDGDALEGIRASQFFTTEKAPAWRRLVHKHLLGDAEFDALKHAVLSDLQKGDFPGKAELFHSAGVLLRLSQEGLLEHDEAAVLALAKAAVDRQFARLVPDAELMYTGYVKPVDEEMAFGIQYAAVSTPAFLELAAYFDQAKSSARAAELARLARNWIAELASDPDLWAARIYAGGGELAHFAFQPIFAQIAPEDLVAQLLKAETPKLLLIGRALKYRYDYVAKREDWKLQELPFWERLLPMLHEGIGSKPPASLSTDTLRRHLMKDIQDFVEAMRAVAALPAGTGDSADARH